MTGLEVVHVICTDNFAGAERYVRNGAVWLTAAGCRVTVVGGNEAAMRPELEAAGAGWLPGATVAQALRSLRRAGRPDVINTHMTAADVAGVIAGRRHGTPVVSTRHFAAPRGSSPTARLVARGIRAGVAAQLAISEFVADAADGPSVTVLSGVEPVPDVAAERRPTVLVAQRLEAEKDTALALEAWARVAADGVGDWRLAIAGRGAQRDELAARARALGIAGSVDFLGHRDDIEALFRTASVLLATAPAEPLGLTVLEAMAHGLPVVAAARGGHLETVGTVHGAALFPPGDADAAAQALARLMANPGERARYGATLRAHQREHLTAARQIEGTLRLYREAVRSR
ncbi:glycosyltransferase family 4 protein [Gryllotalpicola ginsengisoli]|uniref:glycosyltransferase family 4 protein n=1 Tax=Gryllotalpicola ginsengisoli TaxID=444608 RepID=UPI0003B773AD|nr:glycosyltransferase family 4 protein [Gryllotalpicola ginsengisoli]